MNARHDTPEPNEDSRRERDTYSGYSITRANGREGTPRARAPCKGTDDHAEGLADFSQRLFSFANEREIEKLVIDVRWNTGGNTFLAMPLIRDLIGSDKVNRWGKLFVIIGRRTHSAAQNAASMIERHTHAIFVGEPTGSRPNFVGETELFELPYSKLQASVSDLYWQSS